MEWPTQFIEDIQKRHILVVGDLMLDRYLWGHVDRISPEAPVPVLQLQSSDNRMGGAANVALNLVRLGCKSSLIGVVGADANGEDLIRLTREAGVDGSAIITNGDIPTTTKTRVIAGNQHVLRVDDEAILQQSEAQEIAFSKRVIGYMRDHSPEALIIQDYNKGVLTTTVIAAILQGARDMSIPIAVDPKFDNFLAYQGVALFKPNLKELAAQFPFQISPSIESLNRASAELRGSLKHELSCITLSEHGIYVDDGNESAIFPTSSREIVDVCGAGDAVISILTLGLLNGLSHEKLAVVANAAGGAVCTHVGVAPITADQLKKELAVERFL